ncbi:transcriptional regulator [Dyadobacter sp. CY347]|uniref:transcriptional regulator n=1 Tax=Dyadobacter sp. CY347 TaxID=2909336 RepID=UPI001F44EBD0|nr:transcriptional regulator [Dyadobacter sp. CY347]MCF2488197.1 transcriptional regulator [Dyadobacter sp. CY347]
MAKKQGFAVTAFDAREIVERGKISSELEMERAIQSERLLRLMSKDQPELEPLRKEIRDMVIQYESEHWSDADLVTDAQVHESDLAEKQVDKERLFFRKRKSLIIKHLKQNGLNQNDLSAILAHSKSYTSELLNGIRSFSMNDLIIIHKLFKIKLEDLIFTEITPDVELRIRETFEKAAENTSKSKKPAQVTSLMKALYS